MHTSTTSPLRRGFRVTHGRDASACVRPSALPSDARAAFTVIELLVVIGVLAVLLAILLPVFRNAHAATLRTRARIQANALAQAVVQYKNVYGYWPGMVRESGGNIQVDATLSRPAGTIDWPLVSNFSNDWFKVDVKNMDGSSKGDASYVSGNTLYRSLLPFDTRYASDDNKNPLNPHRIHFLDLQGEKTPESVSLPDPWGNQYIVVMGLNPTTTFSHEFKTKDNTVIADISVSNLTAFALSYGADKKTLIFSAGVSQ